MRRRSYTPRPPVSPREVVNSVVFVPCKADSRKYIDVRGWDTVSWAEVDFKLDAMSVSEATVIRRYPHEDGEDVICIDVFGYILAVLTPGVKDLHFWELENNISNLSAILPFLPAAVNSAFGVHWKIKARLDELKEELKLRVRVEVTRQWEATLARQ